MTTTKLLQFAPLRSTCRATRSRTSRQLLAEAGAIGVLFAPIFYYFWPTIRDGVLAVENDTRVFYYPVFAYVADRLRAGSLPLWAPELFGGFPLFADGEAGVLYPFHLLADLLLPTDTAFLWLRPLRFCLSALFMYALCRVLGTGRLGGLVGGIALSLSGFAIAQLHHTNISTGAVWLPLILACSELGLRRSGWRRWCFWLCAGAALAMSALVIHIQVVLMSALALVAFVVYRTLVGPVSLPSPPGVGIGRDMSSASSAPRVGLRHAAPRRRFLLGPLAYPSLSASPLGRVWARLGLAVVAIALPAMVGMALAAVQLLPLAELSQFSPRGGGVDYAFATQYALPSLQLISLLFPDFLVLDGAYWGVWSRWEVHPYVGVAPLILAVFAVVLVRNRYTWFFLALALVGLNLAIGEQSLLGLHRWLVQWPLLNVLRVPGRFTYLFSFGVAVLAAQGAAYLARELRWRPPSTDVLPGRHGNTYLLVAIIVGVQVLAVVLPLALGLASALFAANKDAAVRLLAQFALPLRGLDPQYTVEHLYLATRSALDIAQPSTLRQLVLLLATATLLLLWERLRALGWLWPVALVALVAVDLLAAAVLFHPTVALRDLAAPSGPERFLAEQAGLYRAYTWNRSRDEPNRLLRLGLTDANGYSSLQPTRHAAYAARALEAENRLLDLWNVRYVVRSHRTHAPNEFALTSFNPDRPLASSTRRNPGDIVRFRVPETLADRLELVTTLRAAATVPQSAIVAQLLTTDSAGQQHSFAVRAGLHTADWAWDRPHVHGTVEHLQPPIAYTWQQQADAGPFAAHFYYAAFDLGAAHSIRQVEVQFVHPTAQVQIYGLTLINTPTQSHTPITSLTNANYRQVFSDPDIGVYESLAVLPRAYLVPSAVVVRPAESALDLITRSDFRPEQTVILEEPVSGRLLGSLAAPDPAARPSVTTTAERPTEHECSRDSHDCHVSAGARDR